MATVSIDTSAEPELATYETDVTGVMPRGIVTFIGTTTIPALNSNDVGLYQGTFVLPANFAYLPLSLKVRVDGPSDTALARLQNAVVYFFDCDGVDCQHGLMPNVGIASDPSGTTRSSIASRNPSITNDFSSYFAPIWDDRVYRMVQPLGTVGQVTFKTTLINNVGATTEAMSIVQEYKFLQYTVTQARHALLHMFASSV